MQTRTVEQVESWDARPFSGQVRELHELADEGFSGTVVADDTWVFFLNGRIVGTFQGEIDDVVDTDGTVYTAPDPSLPLLFSMQERGGETRAKYFTNDTPLEEVDETLREANFTGYLELSENVLSGDYYVSYYGGKSLSTAFVGQSDRLVSGEEAFEMANDEVGVFEVRDVSFGITELPKVDDEETEPEESASEKAADSTSDAAAKSGVEAASATTSAEEGTDDGTEATDPTATADSEAGIEDAESSAGPESQAGGDVGETVAETGPETAEDEDPSEPDSATESTPSTDSPTSPSHQDSPATGRTADSPATDSDPDTTPTDAEPESAHERAVREWAEKDRERRDAEGENDLFREEEEWRKTNSIPALDPDESGSGGSPEDTSPSRTSSTKAASSPDQRPNAPAGRSSDQADRRDRDTNALGGREGPAPSRSGRRPASSREPSSESTTADPDGSAASSGATDTRIEQLESELSTIESKRDDLEATVTELRDERSSLEERIDTLESKLETAERSSSSGSPTGPGDLPPSEAIAGTNVFVRYDSKGKPTLEALDGTSVDPDTVNENLRLDHHTTFDASDATVDGQPFERFLQETSRFRFVEWLVRELPYELLDSGGKQGLEKVYDAIPAIDRVEFDGTIDVESSADEGSRYAFDVVVRDRMGDPLIVADSNDDRDPVEEPSMDDLVSGSTAVGTANDSLAGAFYVTTSYFDPKALERAQAAADDGGFFSRGGNESFVKVGRKRGFHLCLVEDRQDSFHVTVPEL